MNLFQSGRKAAQSGCLWSTTKACPEGSRHDLRLRYSRPDRGYDPGRPHSHNAGRIHSADRHPSGGVQPPCKPLRGGLHRNSADGTSLTQNWIRTLYGYYVELDGARVHLPEEKQQALRANNVEPQDITLGIRPEHIMLCSDDQAGGAHQCNRGRIRDDGQLRASPTQTPMAKMLW